MDGSFTTGGSHIVLKLGSGTTAKIETHIDGMNAGKLGIGAASVSVVSSANSAITLLDNAISLVSGERAGLGAVSNRLSSTIANLDQIRVNLSASKGRIEDADFAQETGNLAKGQILQQAATAMLAQANASKQTVLALLQ